MQRIITVLYVTLVLPCFIARAMEAPCVPPPDNTNPLFVYTIPDDKIPLHKLKNASFKISFIQAWLENSFDVTAQEIIFKDYEKKHKTYEVPLEEVTKMLNWHKLNAGKIKDEINNFIINLRKPFEEARGVLSTARIGPMEKAKEDAIAVLTSLNTMGKLLIQKDRLVRYFEYDDLGSDDENTPQLSRNRRYLEHSMEQMHIEHIKRTKLYAMHADAEGKLPINAYIDCLKRVLHSLT